MMCQDIGPNAENAEDEPKISESKFQYCQRDHQANCNHPKPDSEGD